MQPKRNWRVTRNGYDLWEVMSALQKEIRRGNERMAVFWAVELETLNPYSLWRRLTVIASEDIGCADNSIAILTNVLAERYWTSKQKKSDDASLYLVHTVMAMCRAFKSREVDELGIMTYALVRHGTEAGVELPKIPDYALDKHTARGKKLGRGMDHFYEEGAKIFPVAKPSPYTEEIMEFEKTELAKLYWKGNKDEAKKPAEPGKKKNGDENGLDKYMMR